MIIRRNKMSFLCVPISLGLPIIFAVAMAIHIIMALWLSQVGEDDVAPLFIAFSFLSLFMVAFTGSKSVWRVEILQNSIICKGLMPKDTFSLEYEKCTVGLDWHMQNGNKVWWIYLCYGQKPSYKTKNPADRMNALRCQPGFIRIMYRDEVYEALIDVLPKRQKNALYTSRKCAGFDKPGRIL